MVSLRPAQKNDSDFLFAMINDADLVRWNANFKPVDQASHAQWLDATLNSATKKLFIIEQDNVPIGSTQLIDIDPAHQNAELTIRIIQPHQGKGYGREAVNQLCDYARNTLKLHRVWLRVFHTNPRALKSYEHAGFKQEGVMKDGAKIDGKFVDVIVMGKLLNA